MSVYLVTWNINKAGVVYTPARNKFISGFRGLDAVYAGGTLDTVVFVSTLLSSAALYNRLSRNLDKNDTIIVTRVFPNSYNGWLDKKVVAWLKSRVR